MDKQHVDHCAEQQQHIDQHAPFESLICLPTFINHTTRRVLQVLNRQQSQKSPTSFMEIETDNHCPA